MRKWQDIYKLQFKKTYDIYEKLKLAKLKYKEESEEIINLREQFRKEMELYIDMSVRIDDTIGRSRR